MFILVCLRNQKPVKMLNHVFTTTFIQLSANSKLLRQSLEWMFTLGHSLNKLIHQPEIKALYNLRRRWGNSFFSWSEKKKKNFIHKIKKILIKKLLKIVIFFELLTEIYTSNINLISVFQSQFQEQWSLHCIR